MKEREESREKGTEKTGIFNISGQELNKEEIKVLDKGLKYAPVKNVNKYVQVQKFMRTLNQNKYFLSKPDTRPLLRETGCFSTLKNRSVFNPPNTDIKYLEVFRNMVVEDLESLKI